MNRFAAAYFRTFEPFFAFGEKTRADTEKALRGARIAMFPEWYLAVSYLAAAAVGLVGGIALGTWLRVATTLPAALAGVLAVGYAASMFLFVRLGFLLWPRLRSASRAKSIEAEYGSVVTLCYALARGGIPVHRVFRTVADERATYGEISREFGYVLRDMEWLGVDIITALQNTSSTTPSPSLKAFYEGLVSILDSGANPVDYFRRQSETQVDRANAHLEGEIEQVGILAEVYVSGLLVLPLLLMVILSLLSAVGNGTDEILPLIVYLMLPFGTFAYVLLVEMLIPPAKLSTPATPEARLADAGLATFPAEEAALKLPDLGAIPSTKDAEGQAQYVQAAGLRRSMARDSRRERFFAAVGRVFGDATERPLSALFVSFPLAAAIGGALALGAVRTAKGPALAVALTDVGLLAALVAFVPVAVLHEIRVWRARRVEKALPDVLGRLSGFNERGVSLLRAFDILGKTTTGPLAPDLRSMRRDISWHGHLANALARFRAKARTVRVAKLGLLLERASTATGDLKEVLDVAERDATASERLRARKTQSMVSYVIVIYVVFAVFLYVVYVTAGLFFSGDGLVLASKGGEKRGLAPALAQALFFQAVVIQGACAGIVAGKLGETYILSGLKHAALLAAIGWIVFHLGVLP